MKKSGLGLVESPTSELWHNVVYIDLADNRLSELPLFTNCFELKVLMLYNNAELTKIPSFFFFKMPILCILDLSYTSIRELPNCFFELEQLREFYMKGCERFMKLSSEVGKLKKLEKLDLDKTQIIHMPKEVQELINLQSLTLCFYEYRGKKNMQYTSSTIVPSGVISRLKGLKHLSIDVNPDDERWQENIQVILPEILALECLQTISLYIPEPRLLNIILTHIFKLDFRFIVGHHMSRIISSTPPTTVAKFEQSECSLKFVKGVDVPCEVKSVARHTKALFLDRHMTIKDLSAFGMKNIEQLQVCLLAECKEMQTIVDGRCSSGEDIFPRLLLLSVSYMKNLRSICEGQIHSSHCFGMLKSLSLHNCPKLTTIFTLDFLDNLSLLKVLVVNNCPKISALIICGSLEPRVGTFLPKLRTMLLLHLPELISISNGFYMGPNLENIGIYNCPKLQSLSKLELSSQNLKVIKREVKWWETLEWSEVEWGIVGRPYKFDCIFSSINQEADVMSQLGVDDDIDDNTGGIDGEPLQDSNEKVFRDTKQNANKEETSTQELQILGTKPQPCEEPSDVTTDSTVTISGTQAIVVTSENRMSNLKRCKFFGCTKKARGASGLCIRHGGGQRCQKPGCNMGAEGRTAYCKAHGGGRRCQQLGCTKSAEGKTDYCIAHGGGRQCGYPGGCTKAARGRSGLCIRHGGGKRCKEEGCTKSAEGQAGLCVSHGGGRCCQYQGCNKAAQGSTMFCKAHGAGKRCSFLGCKKGAEGSTPLCKAHGGGTKCCLFNGGGICPKSVHEGTNFCVSHGGGKRCAVPGCTKSARGRTDCCVRHEGGKRCKFEGCGMSAQGSTDFCQAHGGVKRCSWGIGEWEKFSRGKSGLCADHGRLVHEHETSKGIFQGLVPSASAACSSVDNNNSSSGISVVSDCYVSMEDPAKRQNLVPEEVFVPLSMKPPSLLSFLTAKKAEEDKKGMAVAVHEERALF